MRARVLTPCLAVLAAAVLSGAASCRPAPVSAPRPGPGFPIVFVLIDALRADRLLPAEGREAVAPNLLALARDGVTFLNAFASAPKTIPSVPQMFTSRHFPDLDHETTLLSVCRDGGYDATAAFIHNPYATKWLGRLQPTFDRLGGGEVDAARLTDEAIAWMDSRPSDRFALYVHYLDVHFPLKPPPEVASRFVDASYAGRIGLEFGDLNGAWAGRYGPEDRRRIGQLYDAALAATDAQVGRILDRLRTEGLYDRALVVVTADHGEELWDHGGFFHGHSLYDELLHVPLVVKFPGDWAAGSSVDALARSVDILPTVADLVARSRGEEGEGLPDADGQSLVPLVQGDAPPRTLFATVGRIDDRSPPLHAVRTATAKLIRSEEDGREFLFDLVRDPGEREDLSRDPAQAGLLQRMRAELDRFLAPLARGVHARLFNGASQALHYRLETGLKPIAPFVNLQRVALEPGDRIEPQPGARGLVASGVLEPGEEDEVRFDVLASDATLVASFETGEAAGTGPAVELCVAGEPSCAPLEERRVELPLSRVVADRTPPRRTASAVVLQWWRVNGESAPLAPALSTADRERLRALGYAE